MARYSSKTNDLRDIDLSFMGVFSVLCLLCLCVRLFICALWSTAGKKG